MNKSLVAIWRYIFPEKTVADVLSGFQKTVDNLCKVNEKNLAKAEEFRIASEKNLALSKAAQVEAEAAATVHAKIKSLIGV